MFEFCPNCGAVAELWRKDGVLFLAHEDAELDDECSLDRLSADERDAIRVALERKAKVSA